MELQKILSVVLLVFVYGISSTGWIHRAAAAVVGALVVSAFWGFPTLTSFLLPDVLLVTAGLMVLAAFVRRSGIASWLALKAAKVGHGSAGRLLVMTGLLSWILGALLGPVAAVLLIPMVLLLSGELDVPALPFVVVLTWTGLLGAATVVTALPGNLWLGAAFGVGPVEWFLTLWPYTTLGLVVTLVTAVLVFRKKLRVTNERRARVLEYDETQSLNDRPLALKTSVILFLVVVGFVAGPWLGLSPSLIAVGGAVLLWLWDSPRNSDRLLSDLDGGTLLYLAGLMAVVGALAASGASALPLTADPRVLTTLTALGAALFDQNAVAGLAAAVFGKDGSAWWALALGTAIGAGTSVLGSTAAAATLSLTGQGARRVTWRQFTLYGVLFGAINWVAVVVVQTLRM